MKGTENNNKMISSIFCSDKCQSCYKRDVKRKNQSKSSLKLIIQCNQKRHRLMMMIGIK